jgi:hypothetical protein
MASEAQVKFMTGLAEKKDMTKASPELNAWMNTPLALENATNNEVNLLLDALKQLPNKPPALTTEQLELTVLEGKVGKGHYFIIDPYDGAEKFVKVDKPEAPSRWAGYTFISSQGGSFFYRVKDADHRKKILQAISVDPITAMNEYGIRLGVCGYCGRTLTARDSRLRGMGPICAARIMGAPTQDQIDLLDRLGLRKKSPEEGGE